MKEQKKNKHMNHKKMYNFVFKLVNKNKINTRKMIKAKSEKIAIKN